MRYEIRDNFMSTIQSAIADDQIIDISSSFEFLYLLLRPLKNHTFCQRQNEQKHLIKMVKKSDCFHNFHQDERGPLNT